MSYASSCIQTLDYLLRKHDKLLRETVRLPDTMKAISTRDYAPMTPLTEQEHDRIWHLCRTSKLSNNQIARQSGRSPTVVSLIRHNKHRLYNAERLTTAA